MGQSAIVLVGLRKRSRIHLADPALICTGAVFGNDQPKETARRLAWNFVPGEQHLAKQGLEIEFVPVYIENLNRVMPKGEILPIPILCSVTFGTPLVPDPVEGKTAFLGRARDALLELSKR